MELASNLGFASGLNVAAEIGMTFESGLDMASDVDLPPSALNCAFWLARASGFDLFFLLEFASVPLSIPASVSADCRWRLQKPQLESSASDWASPWARCQASG